MNKWRCVAEDWGEDQWKDNYPGQGSSYESDSTRFLLKPGQGDKICRMEDEGFDLLSRMIRYEGKKIFAKLTQQNSFQNWAKQGQDENPRLEPH